MIAILALITLVLALVSGCSEPGVQTAKPAGEDAFYAVALTEGLNHALEWLGGLPAPAKYCVAITGGEADPDWQGARAPGEVLLQQLNSSSRSATFYSFTDCSVEYPATAPDGERAGLLWVEPLGADRRELMVGWVGLRDGTGWACRFQEVDGDVEAAECDKWWES